MELENILTSPFLSYQLYKFNDKGKELILFFNGNSYLLPDKEILIDMIKLLKNTVQDFDNAKNYVLILNEIIKEDPPNNINQIVKKRRPGFIYLVFCNATNLYKIGSSKNVIDRIKYLKTANPKIEFIYSYPVENMLIEKEIHSNYKDKRVSGEWFELSFSDVSKIITYLKTNSK